MLRPEGFPEWTEPYYVNGSFYNTSTIFMDDLIEKYLSEGRIPDWFPKDRPPEYWEIPGYDAKANWDTWHQVRILENAGNMVMVHDWLVENVKGKWYSGTAGQYLFSESEEALLFKLAMPTKDA